jgi:hypothetical protein
MHGVRFILLYILFCLETKCTLGLDSLSCTFSSAWRPKALVLLAVASGAKKQKKPTHEGQALLSIYILNTSCDAFL